MWKTITRWTWDANAAELVLLFLAGVLAYGVVIGLLRRLELWYRHRREDEGW
jgi:hypothetical protein